MKNNHGAVNMIALGKFLNLLRAEINENVSAKNKIKLLALS